MYRLHISPSNVSLTNTPSTVEPFIPYPQYGIQQPGNLYIYIYIYIYI